MEGLATVGSDLAFIDNDNVGVIETRPENGLPNYRLFSTDPLLRPLAGHAEFYAFLTGLRRDHDSYCDEFGLERET